MKSTRFASVVASAGAPAPHPLWVPPAEDRTLQRALKENRVMTVHQDVRGSRKDFGSVGFSQEPTAQFLVFPKSLKAFTGQRIIGIDYALLAAEATRPAPAKAPAPARKGRQQPPPKGRKPAPDLENERVVPFEPSEPAPAPAVAPAAAPRVAKSRPAKVKTRPSKPKRTRSPPAAAPMPPRDAAPAAAPSPTAAVELSEVTQQLRRAISDLKAGKAVAAYERLQSLLSRMDKA